jgi:class 3 adenylate cyclase/sugar lactone lactonase YvrE
MSKRSGDRRLAAVLFTDIVSSTEVASELGDARWRELLGRHHRIVRSQLKRFGGHEQDTAGDGFFATFDVPADAVRCAAAAQREVRELGIEIRAGVNFGEIEMVDGKPGGLVVHTGARIMGASSAGVVTVSSSVRELLPGAGIAFEDAGMHRLKGLDEESHLYRVTRIDDDPVAPPETDAAAARERRDRIVDPGPAKRRTALVVGGVVGALVLVGVLAFSLGGEDGSPATEASGPPSSALVALDPTTGDQGQVIPIEVQPQTQFFPRGAAGEGGVWLGRDVNLLHVDPRHKEVEPVNLETTGGLNVDTGFGRVWVTVYGVSTVNVGTNELRRFVRTDHGVGIGSGFVGIESGLVAAEGAVWVTSTDGRLLRIDPNDPGATRLAESPTGELDGLDVGEDGVWTFDAYDGSIIRFDPDTLRPDDPIAVSGGVDEIALVGGDLWVLDRSAGTVFPLGSSNSTQVGENPTVMSAGFDGLWVGDEDGTVYRVDPITGDAGVMYRAGGVVNALIPDPDNEVMWVDVGSASG